MKRSLKPRKRDTVVNRNLDSEKKQSSFKNPLINPKLENVRVVRPGVWKKGLCVVRIWPMIDPENPTTSLLNGRLSSEGISGLGGMAISEPVEVISFAGIPGELGVMRRVFADKSEAAQFSYIVARNRFQSIHGIPYNAEPYVVLRNVAERAMTAGEFASGRAWDSRWNFLFPADKQRKMDNQPLPYPKKMYFAVVSVYENGPDLDLIREHKEYNSKNGPVIEDTPRNGIPLGEAKDDPLIVMPLSASAGRALLSMCCKEKKEWSGNDAQDPNLPFLYGDPTGSFNADTQTVDGGLFFTIYNPSVVTVDKHTSYTGKSDGGFQEYAVAVSRNYKGPKGNVSPSLSTEQVENVLNKSLFFWRDGEDDSDTSFLLHEPSIEERCVMIARGFKCMPKLLEFGWTSYPEYLEFDAVQAIVRNRTTVDMGKKAQDEEDDDSLFEDDGEVEVETKVKAKSVTTQTKVVSAKAIVEEAEDDSEDFEDDFEDGVEAEAEIEVEAEAEIEDESDDSEEDVEAVEDDDDAFDDEEFDDAAEEVFSDELSKEDQDDLDAQLNASLQKAKQAGSRASKPLDIKKKKKK